MEDVDIDPFGEHGKTDEMTDETFPLIPRGRSTWEPERKCVQEASFGGESETLKEEKVKEL